MQNRISPSISSVIDSGGQSKGVKRALDGRERLEPVLQDGGRRERFWAVPWSHSSNK